MATDYPSGSLSFEWSGPGLLKDALNAPFVKASVYAHGVNGIGVLTLWSSDLTGLRILSNMFYVAYRDEVGVLSFDVLSSGPGENEIVVDLPSSFLVKRNLAKLVSTEENGFLAKSGIVMTLDDGHEVIIVAGSFPLTLSVLGIPGLGYPFKPEQPISNYRRKTL